MTTLDALRPTTEYFRFRPHRKPEEYLGQAGPHFGLALEPAVLDAIADAKATGRPNQYAVIGEWRRSDGVRFLDVGVTREWLETVTNYRLDDNGRLRWTCPECGKLGGQHTKACGYE